MSTGNDLMQFEAHFQSATPDWLIDPQLKIRLGTSGHKESGPDDAMLNISYDPEIRADRLTIPPTAEQRTRRLSIPSLAHLADEPNVFQSDSSIPLASLGFKSEVRDGVLRHRIEEDRYRFRLAEDSIIRLGIPGISDSPNLVLLSCLRALTKFDNIRLQPLSRRYSHFRSIEVWVRSDIMKDLPSMSAEGPPSIEPGWSLLASREVGR